MTRKAGEEVIIVGMKGGEAYNGRKAIWLNFDRERNKHRIKVFVNVGLLDDEILLVKGENITSDKKFLKEHPEYDTPHKRKRLGTLDEVLKENEEKKKKEKGQKKLIENPFVKKDGKIVEKPKTKRATVKKRGWTPGSYARARAQAAREGEGGRFARREEEEDEHEGGEEEEEDFFTTSAPSIEKLRSCDRNLHREREREKESVRERGERENRAIVIPRSRKN